MSERLALAAIALAAASGVPGLFLDRRSASGERIAATLMGLAAAAGVGGASLALAGFGHGGLHQPWSVPGGSLSVEVDAISAMFLIPTLLIPFLSSIFGLGYWAQQDHPLNGRKLRLFHGLLAAGMALVVVAQNAVLFLAGWEVMAVSAWLALTTEDEKTEVRAVGYVFFVAARLATLCLFAMFALLHDATGSFELARPPTMQLADGIFLLAVAGFGLKAGIMPFHVWLPGAHANAPSHVSAVLSGVLLKMGVYGLIRITSLFAHPPMWWGGLVLALGTFSAIFGVALALAQHDLKRLLAYHSVENIGIIWMGLGTALLGRSLGRGDLVALGLAGALLHTWNHGLFKSLLFLTAGSVVHATHTREIDALGGLSRLMPWTALFFLIGAVAICGLPPLNGFASELLVYLGLLHQVTSHGGGLWLAGALATPALALVGALALACFVKVYGVAFLGQARSAHARHAVEAGRPMLIPMGVLTALCFGIAVGVPLLAPILDRAVAAWASELPAGSLAELAPLNWSSAGGVTFLALAAFLGALLQRSVRRQGAPAEVGTWDCGYAAPGSSMQYSASSFAQTLVRLFGWALRPETYLPRLATAFPEPTAFHSDVPEPVLDRIILPSSRTVGDAFEWMRWMQQGSVNQYLLYILLTLVSLFAWRLM